jgi:hypothetical protein
VSILAILKRRGHVSPQEYATFYEQGDEVASIIFGLQRATFEAEAEQPTSSRSLRESDEDYLIPGDMEPSL